MMIRVTTHILERKDLKKAKKLYDLFLENKLYVPGASFQDVWTKGSLYSHSPYQGTVAVAWNGDVPIGVSILPKDEFFGWAPYGDSHSAEGFLSVYVKPEYRKQGLGGLLLNKVLKRSGAKNVFIADHVKHLVTSKSVIIQGMSQ